MINIQRPPLRPFYVNLYFSDGDEIVENKTVGHLLRTKSVIHDDGGVAALRAVLDSPCLV